VLAMMPAIDSFGACVRCVAHAKLHADVLRMSSLLPLELSLLAPDWSPIASFFFAGNASGGGNGYGPDGGNGRRNHGLGVEGHSMLSWYVAGRGDGDVAGRGDGDVAISARYLRVSLPRNCALDTDEGDQTGGGGRQRQLALLEVAVFTWQHWNCTLHCEDLGRGRCPTAQPERASGACECAPDRVGPDCATHLLTDFASLPPALPLPPSRSNSLHHEHPRWSEHVLRQAEAEVKEAQRGGDCTSRDALVVGYHPGGMAASLSLIASILSMTLSLNRSMLLWRKAEWFYADTHECPDHQVPPDTSPPSCLLLSPPPPFSPLLAHPRTPPPDSSRARLIDDRRPEDSRPEHVLSLYKECVISL
jgi:hypothetical protein